MMNLSISNENFIITDNTVKTTSLKIAEKFGKLHKNVLRDINKLECSEEFRRLNFEPRDYIDSRGKKQTMFEVTKDGFMFLVMGFTGGKASQVKEAYINAFNQMAKTLSFSVPTNLKEALQLALNQEEKLEQQQQKLLENQQFIEEISPQIEAVANLTNSDGLTCITTVAKMAGYGQKEFHQILKERKWVFKREGNKNWEAYHDKIAKKYLKVKEYEYRKDKYTESVYFTKKGIVAIFAQLNVNLEEAA